MLRSRTPMKFQIILSMAKEKTRRREHKRLYCHSFKLSEEDNALFLKLFLSSGVHTKTKFIRSILLNRPIKVVAIDKNGLDFCILLTDFYNQYQAIGNNYNQAVRKINNSLSERSANYNISILKNHTMEMVAVSETIFRLSKEFEKRWSKNE